VQHPLPAAAPNRGGRRRGPYADGTDAAWFWRGLFSNVTSPTVGVFFTTFLPQFVPADVAAVPWIALFVVSHVVLSVIWLGLVIVAPRSIGCLLQRSAVSRTLDRVRGAVPVGTGLRLAAEGGREDRVIMQW
jgi:threonine/homoserine/homoserine lactone efflux protein